MICSNRSREIQSAIGHSGGTHWWTNIHESRVAGWSPWESWINSHESVDYSLFVPWRVCSSYLFVQWGQQVRRQKTDQVGHWEAVLLFRTLCHHYRACILWPIYHSTMITVLTNGCRCCRPVERLWLGPITQELCVSNTCIWILLTWTPYMYLSIRVGTYVLELINGCLYYVMQLLTGERRWLASPTGDGSCVGRGWFKSIYQLVLCALLC